MNKKLTNDQNKFISYFIGLMSVEEILKTMEINSKEFYVWINDNVFMDELKQQAINVCKIISYDKAKKGNVEMIKLLLQENKKNDEDEVKNISKYKTLLKMDDDNNFES